MANINKIRLSGQTYNIEDVNASKTVELTQAQYDALTVKDQNTFYVITDAQGADLSNYYTKSETSGATEISTALNAKQDTLVSGTNIKTINNESILGSGNIEIQGGGKAIEGGRGITVTSGETADTVSFNLPISANTGNSIYGYTQSEINGSGNFVFGDSNFAAAYPNATNNSAIFGDQNHLGKGFYSYVFGFDNIAACQNVFVFGRGNRVNENYRNRGDYNQVYGSENNIIITKANKSAINNHIIGDYNTITNISRGYIFGFNNTISNDEETALGHYNLSNTGSTDADKSLFSVGNGTSSARHNAFEIRQNGDIYLTKDGQDVKLQDQLGGGEASSAITSGDTNAVAGGAVYDKFDEVEQVTAAGLNALNDKFDGLKLMKISQTDYDNLQVKDQNTLYIVIQ